MGYSSYDFQSRSKSTQNYAHRSTSDIFTQTRESSIHESMNPYGIKFREARDSELHPNSVPIIMGLDVTGSMGRIPERLIREDLPTLISKIMEKGIPDPQLLFIALGDQYSDKAPVQVGQFESGDKEMDMWLTRTWLEGNGGGDSHESYLFAWYIAAMHTITDSMEKRNKKGFLFTIGDEKCHPVLEASSIRKFIGVPEAKSYTRQELLELAKESYHVYHLNLIKGSYGTWPEEQWREILGNNLISVNDITEIPSIISDIISKNSDKIFIKTQIVNEEENTSSVTSSQPVILL